VNEYLVVVERGERNYSAYLPDLPGCATTGDTREEALALMKEAVALHLKGMREDGVPIPTPTASAEYLAVAV
jgi:predicted RNase H-like HicB family nuclease